MKKVVFISPMYNAESHLKDLVDSIKEQSNDNWEHVIIDDMSSDDSYLCRRCIMQRKYS